MNLTAAYQEARAEAVQEGQRLVLENLLRVRFGNLDNELSRTIDNLLNLPIDEYSRLLLHLNNLSREELLARFNN
jgi:hypothetical protein